MESSTMIETQSKGAEIYHGEACKEKLDNLLEEFSVPKGIFHFGQIEEIGLNRSTGFFWLKQEGKTEHRFASLGSLVYNKEITSFIEPYHMKSIIGLQGCLYTVECMFIAAAVNDVHVGVPSEDKIRFTSSTGLSRETLISLFEPADENKNS